MKKLSEIFLGDLGIVVACLEQIRDMGEISGYMDTIGWDEDHIDLTEEELQVKIHSLIETGLKLQDNPNL